VGDDERLTVVAPSWRRDLTREIDLVEEVGRIHGYEKIPEDVRVPMASSLRTRDDRVLAKVRQVLTASGVDEAMTLSAVEESLSAAFSPWSDCPPLVSQIPVLRGANRLRRSLAPSLLAARRTNESLCNPQIELFEIARVYLTRAGQLPAEELMVALTSGRDLATVRGIVEAIVAALNPAIRLEAEPVLPEFTLLDANYTCQFFIHSGDSDRPARQLLGFVGPVSADGLRQFDLRGPTVVAELKLSRAGSLGRRRADGRSHLRPVLRGIDLPRHVSRRPAPRSRQEEPALDV
jgi:phenylalanyl-tRNA synthetase beta chain